MANGGVGVLAQTTQPLLLELSACSYGLGFCETSFGDFGSLPDFVRRSGNYEISDIIFNDIFFCFFF